MMVWLQHKIMSKFDHEMKTTGAEAASSEANKQKYKTDLILKIFTRVAA